MKRLIMIMCVLLILTGCSKTPDEEKVTATPSTGSIYLYGEKHAVKGILDKELELWGQYYTDQNLRHLFIELPYYTAEYLNLWMQAEDDTILNEVYEDWKGTLCYNPLVKTFYKSIKENYPETVFHGTDVGHQFFSTGERYLKYLEAQGLKDSEAYLKTSENIGQGTLYTSKSDNVYRENKMVENFKNAFDALDGESVMGIYGSAHTPLDLTNETLDVKVMATQLKDRYGDQITSEDLSPYALMTEAIRVDEMDINGKTYKALYFGKSDFTNFKDLASREVWQLENAYEDFKDLKKLENVLPYNNYPMFVEKNQVFVIEYTKTDGSVKREYHISDGMIWNNMESTEEVEVLK